MTTITEIRDYAAKIAERFRPEKIILFGSFANGRPTEDSDVDLLIVMPFRGRGWEKATEISLELEAPFAMDMLVRRQSDIELRLKEGDPFFTEVLNFGKILYAGEHIQVA